LSDIEVMRLEKDAEEVYTLVKDPVSEAKRAANREGSGGENPGAAEPEFSAGDFREAKKQAREAAKAENEAGMGAVDTADYTLTVVFPNNQEKRDFMRKIRKDPKEKYVKSAILLDLYNRVYDISVFNNEG
jgi:hypothetical protein